MKFSLTPGVKEKSWSLVRERCLLKLSFFCIWWIWLSMPNFTMSNDGWFMKTAEKFEYFLAFLASSDRQNFLFYQGGNAKSNQTEQGGLALYLRGWVTTKIISNKKQTKQNQKNPTENICDRLSSFPSLLVSCKNMPCCWAAQMPVIIGTTPWASQ